MADATQAAQAAFSWNPLISSAIGLAGNIFGANSSADAARQQQALEQQQIDFAQQQQKAREAAYQNNLATGTTMANQGEQGFLAANNQAPAALGQAQQDILTQNAKALNQGAGTLQANLAASGVRGGQAANQLREGVGQMATTAQQNLTNLGLSDEEARQAQLAAFMQNKAATGQQAQVRPATF